jgi:hypothetical protein
MRNISYLLKELQIQGKRFKTKEKNACKAANVQNAQNDEFTESGHDYVSRRCKFGVQSRAGFIKTGWQDAVYFGRRFDEFWLFLCSPSYTCRAGYSIENSYHAKRVTTRCQVYAWRCNIWLYFTL